MKQLIIYLLSGLFLFSGFSCKVGHRQKRVLTLGIRHESNTFSTLLTKESDFKVLRGADVLKGQLSLMNSNRGDMRTLPFKNVHRPCFPLDMDMVWKPI